MLAMVRTFTSSSRNRKTIGILRICSLNEDDICLCCFRSLEEVVQWRQSSELQKRQVLNQAKARNADHRRKLGGKFLE